MSTFTTYCDLGFLSAYYRAKPTGDVAAFDEDDELWLAINSFLRRHTDLVIGAPKDDLHQMIGRYPFLRQLMDKPAGTRCTFDADRVRDAEEMSAHASQRHPWRLFLLDDTETPQQELSALYGTLFLSADDVGDVWKRIGRQALLNVSSQAGEGRRLSSWTDLREFAAPLTALLVCDRYMLKNMKVARENIVPMLVNLLPDEANLLPVAIMLVTEEVDDRYSLQEIWEEVFEALRAERPELAFELSIVAARGRQSLQAYHDRHVFANYGFMKSGRSFDYFQNGKLKRTTTLDFHPTLDQSCLTTATEKLKAIKEIVDNTSIKYGNDRNVIGSKDHPLLRAVTIHTRSNN